MGITFPGGGGGGAGGLPAGGREGQVVTHPNTWGYPLDGVKALAGGQEVDFQFTVGAGGWTITAGNSRSDLGPVQVSMYLADPGSLDAAVDPPTYEEMMALDWEISAGFPQTLTGSAATSVFGGDVPFEFIPAAPQAIKLLVSWGRGGGYGTAECFYLYRDTPDATDLGTNFWAGVVDSSFTIGWEDGSGLTDRLSTHGPAHTPNSGETVTTPGDPTDDPDPSLIAVTSLLLRSPDGTVWDVTVDDTGTLDTTEV